MVVVGGDDVAALEVVPTDVGLKLLPLLLLLTYLNVVVFGITVDTDCTRQNNKNNNNIRVNTEYQTDQMRIFHQTVHEH